ncbi:MAG TPA: hypothetical protein VHE59_14615 [Mucilaginibacter sp.]|nr:hypothetical protein [Mucilaginibacter sp.]
MDSSTKKMTKLDTLLVVSIYSISIITFCFVCGLVIRTIIK